MPSDVAETFRDGSILVTGSTGFLGVLLMEKLLRSCPLENIVVLVRSKRMLSAHRRMKDIFEKPLFDRVRKDKPDIMNFVKIIEGSIEELPFCLSSIDHDWIIENVNFVFHCAATVKFNEPLHVATKINVQGTENILNLAKEMKNLKGFVHVSTAYSHCNRDEIREQFYPTPITADELKNMNESIMNVAAKWPNTYTFTKAITENMIETNENNLPISIFRPSVFSSTNSEPYPGWLENFRGASNTIIPVIIGLRRVFLLDTSIKWDLTPADYIVNSLISVMWDTVKSHQDTNQVKDPKIKPKIFNFVSGPDSPLTCGELFNMMNTNYKENPPLSSIWYKFCIFSTNSWVVYFLKFPLHWIPATLTDLFLIIVGKSPRMMNEYSKDEFLLNTINQFTTNEWTFDNTNTNELWSILSQDDRNLFPFSFKKFNWKSYNKNYYIGIKKYLLRENENDLEKALIKNRRLFWIHYTVVALFIYLILRVVFICIRYMGL